MYLSKRRQKSVSRLIIQNGGQTCSTAWIWSALHDKREVITEDRVVIDGQTKQPDYTLCYGGERKMYVEAKQPSVNLKDDPEPALQLAAFSGSDADRSLLEQRVSLIDSQINALVYKLYGLTAEEIAVVEGK